MEIDRGRNCKRFRHIVRYCMNSRFVIQDRRMEYRDNHNMDNLKEEENLVVFD